MFAVSSAWLKLSATKRDRAEVVHLVGLGHLERRHQRRQVGEVARHQLDERHLLDAAGVGLRVVLPLHHPEHVVALAVQELGEVLAVLAGDPGDERAGHGASRYASGGPHGPFALRSTSARWSATAPASAPPSPSWRPPWPLIRTSWSDPYLLSFRARPDRDPPPAAPRRPRPSAVDHADSTPRRSMAGPAEVVHGTNYVVPPSRLPRLVSVYDCWFLADPGLAAPDVAAPAAC